MGEGVSLLFGEGIDGLDAREFCSGELGKALLWLDLFLLKHLDLLVGASLLQGHGLGDFAGGLEGGLHSVIKNLRK